MGRFGEKAFDTHFHYTRTERFYPSYEYLLQSCHDLDLERIGLLSLPTSGGDAKYVGNEPLRRLQNIEGAAFKVMLSKHLPTYAMAGLWHDPSIPESEQADEFLRQLQLYYDCGYDGLKMLEGIPKIVRRHGRLPNHPVYDKVYSFLEEKQFPLVMHLANPNDLWDEEKLLPSHKGMLLTEEDGFPPLAAFYEALFDLLERHPRLPLWIAHWGFMSTHIEDARRFLSYPNTMLDVTPGPHELYHIGQNYDEWREFIHAHADRIIFGTDSYNGKTDYLRPTLLRNFFGPTDEIFDYVGYPYRGLALPEEKRRMILNDNAYRLLGKPRPFNKEPLIAYIAEVEEMIKDGSGLEKEEFSFMEKELLAADE